MDYEEVKWECEEARTQIEAMFNFYADEVPEAITSHVARVQIRLNGIASEIGDLMLSIEELTSQE